MSSHRSTGSGAESSRSRNGQQNLQQVATQANALVGSTAGGANRGGNSESVPLRTVYVTNTARDAFNKVQHKYAAQILDGPQGESARVMHQPQVDRIQGLFDKVNAMVETPLGQLAEAGPTETMEERGKLVMAYVRHIEGLIQALSQAPRQN
ncbi:hypothetical protein MGG_01904 [Pyricularia oryzae 70-15]|uniref:Uncharacterized protein n=3 Tax=Pyricularia oryzae TaxID=318829 RepID=G4NG31_PYRO7|nr:uncharacterized protein MGG_01904 [Pyricularia oryzae 70-15]EHA46988.1 hypothetical protein MGG_01904 [Pyricularia oryzae 70-15]ELQ35500.1 hypothetical protein OOU_Y34scaffold00706g4 [Pyricularia oryzae Y34]KAI7912930.1 hypothetical protein M9X92_009744 [Pyricularia oryzae]KAI7918201.1 hypothetical protein M0657_007694 [Pyricularia oryzae]